MSVNKADEDLLRVEADAQAQAQGQPQSSHYNEKPTAEAERPGSSGSTSSSSGSSSSVDYDPQFRRLQSRNTEVDLERQRTNTSQALSRIETQRLQHSMTVGESIKTRPSKLPLPAFGGGKPYPPQLPNREDFVVEFDGPDDPLYPQNWPLKTK
jgi:DHA1 family multidrug resistance protein-like MFS transporter